MRSGKKAVVGMVREQPKRPYLLLKVESLADGDAVLREVGSYGALLFTRR